MARTKKPQQKTKVKKEKPDAKNTKSKKSVIKSKNKIDMVSDKIHLLRKKKYFPYLFTFLVLISVAYFGRSLLFAALVGGKPISRIQLISELEKQAGQQALDALVTKELLSQEAQKKGINVTDVDISSEIQRISDLLSEQGTSLDAALATQGMSKDDLNENIRMQKTVEKLLEDSISVSEEDVADYYDKNKSYYGDAAKFEDIKDSIRDQISQEKLAAEYQSLLQRLKNEGNVIYFVDF